MKKNSMRLLGFLLMAVMMVSLFAVGVFAEDTANVAKIGDTEYATLQAAMKACVAGDNTITLLKDSAEVFTFAQKSGVNITVDGDGHTFSGKITLGEGGGNLTFTDATITPANSQTIYLSESTAPNVTFEDCVLQGVNKSGAIVYGNASNTYNAIAVKNCTADNLQYIVSFRQTGSNSVLVENVEATNMIYLVRTLKCPSVTIKNVTCDAVIGVDIKNDGAGGKLTLENVSINVYTYGGSLYFPVSGSGAGKAWTVEVKGVNFFTANGLPFEGDSWFYGNSGYHIVLAEDALVNPAAAVNGICFKTITEAIAAANAAENGATVTLLADVALDAKITITGNVTIKGAYTITRGDAYTGTLFTVNAGATLTLDGGLTIDGGNNWAYTVFPPVMDLENSSGTKVADHITPAEGGVNATAHMIVNNGTLNVHSVTIENSYSTGGFSIINAGASSVTTLNGATICHNAANRSGAIANIGGNDAVLTIKGTTRITDNFGIGNGGIIQNYGQGTTVNFEGGSIDNNFVGSSGTLYASYSNNANKINTFNMTGGIITKNVMEGYGPVYIHTNTVWNMSGGEISENVSYLPSYVRNNNPAGTMTGGKIVNNEITGLDYSNGYYVTHPDLRLNGKTAISGGTFTQDVFEWLAPNTGLVYNEATGTYTTTHTIWEMHLTDANGDAHWLSPMTSDTLSSILSISKVWYDSLQGGYSFTLKLLSNVKVNETGIVNFPLTIDLNGYTVTGMNIYPVIRVQEGATVTVTGNGSIVNATDYVFVLGSSDQTSAGYLTIENGTFVGETTVASVTKGILSVNGGTFKCTASEYGSDYMFNCVDANYKNGTAQIVVKGGTFVGFDPMNNAAEGAGTNFCSDGHIAEELTEGYFTVRKANYVAEVNGVKYESLQDAINACTNGETVKLLTNIVYGEDDIIAAVGGATGFGDYYNPAINYVGGTKGNPNLPSNVNVVIDLNGYSITNNAEAYLFLFMDNCKVTIKDSKDGDGIIDNTEAPVIWVTGTDTLVTIESGKYTTVNAEGLLWSTHGGDLVIKGGEFSTSADDASLLIIRNAQDRRNPNYFIDGKATVTIYGGTFYGFDPEKMMDDSTNPFTEFDACADGYKSIKNGNAYTVENYVEWIKQQLLLGNDVVLEKDIVVDGSMIESIPAPTNGNGKYPNYGIFNVVGDYDVTFDLNGHSITYNGHESFEWNGKTVNSCTVAHGLFYANAGAHLTVKDSVGTGTVTVYGLASGVYVASPDTTFTITGGTWKNEGCAECGGTNIFLYPLQGGELYIEGGYFEQALDANGDSYLLVLHGGEYANSVIDYAKTKLVVSGGTFVGMNPNQARYFYQGADNKTDMSQTANVVALGYAVVDNGNGVWTVVDAVAHINGIGYATLADAIDAAKAGDTITFLADITEDVTVNKSVTIDGADFTYTGQMKLTSGTNITIKNVNFDGKGFNGYAIETRGASYLTVEDCTAKNYGYGFVQLASATVLTTVKNVTVTNVNYGVKVDYSSAVVLENVDITAVAAVYNSNYGEKTITIKDSYLSSLVTWKRNETIKTTYVFEGANAIDEFITYAAIDSFKLANVTSTLTAPEGQNVTIDEEGYSVKYVGGTYTVKKVTVTISSVEDLLAFGNAVTTNTLYQGVKVAANSDVIVLLTADLDLTDSGFAPMGNGAANAFSGTFDGQGHTISNMTLTCNYYRGVGFFRSLGKGAVIKNLTFVNADVNNGAATGANHFYGVVAGFSNNVTLDNVDIRDSKVTCKYTGSAMIGCLEGASTIKNCDIENVILNTTSIRGAVYGILGNSANGHSATLENNTVNNVVFIVDGEIKAVQETLKYNEWADGTEYTESMYVAQIGETKYTTLADAIAAAKDGDTVTLIGNVIRASTLVVDKDVTIDLNGYTVNGSEYIKSAPVFRVLAEVTVKNGTVDGRGGSSCYAFIVGNGTTAGNLTIVDGKYYGDVSVVSVTNGTLTVLGGYFEATEYNGAHEFTLNCIDSAYNNGTAKIVVKGGTFYKFDPEDNAAEGAGTNFVAKGYKSVDNSDGTFTVEANKIFKLHIVDPMTGEPAFIPYIEGNDLATVIATGKNFYANYYEMTLEILGDWTVDSTVIVDYPMTIDLGGYTISAEDTVVSSPVFRILSDVTVKNGTVDGRGGSSCYAFIVGDSTTAGNLTIVDGKYYGDVSVVSVTNGTLTVEGGYFEATEYNGAHEFTLNCIDSAYNNGTAKIVVKGGTFYKFDPEDNAAEGKNTNFVADHYASVEIEENVWKVVAKVYVAEVNGVKYETLQEAINACTNGETVKLLTDIVYGDDDIVAAVGGATGFGDYYNPAINYVGGTKGTPNLPSNVNVVIDLNGYSITNNAEAYLFLFMDNCRVTIKDSGNGAGIIGNSEAPIIWVVGTETLVTIENGKYFIGDYGSMIWSTHGGDLVINGGEFRTSAEDASSLIMRNSKNRQNSKFFITGNATVTITGGTFYGFNPEKMLDDAKTPAFEFNAVAEGYRSYEVEENVWIIISADSVVKLVNKITGDIEFFDSIAAAMAEAQKTTGEDTVYLIKDHTESVVLVYDGVVLDVQNYTLTADYLVVFKGGYLTGKSYSATRASGTIKIDKDRVIVAEGCYADNTSALLLTWNKDASAYVFGRFVIKNDPAEDSKLGAKVDENGTLTVDFKVQTNGSTAAFMTGDVYENHGVSFRVVAEWTANGVTTIKTYVFNDEMVQECFSSNKSLRFTLADADAIENLSVKLQVVSDTGSVVEVVQTLPEI